MREKQAADHSSPAQHRTEDKASFLAQNALFQHLSGEELHELERVTTLLTCPAGRILYRPGDKSSALFLLHTGQVELYHLSPDGRKLITTTLVAGACFGEMAIVGRGMHTSFAESTEDARVYAINKNEIEHLLHQHPSMAIALLDLLQQRYTWLEGQLIDTTFKGVTARLATLLLTLATAQQAEQQRMVVDGLSQEELAARLGVYRETVSVSLRELKDAGAIEPARKHITITNPALLEELAAF